MTIPEINGSLFEQQMVCLLFASTPKGRGVPFVMVGEPGAAKSALIEEFNQRYGLPTVTVSPGLMGEAFFGVTPVPTSTIDDGDVLTFPPPQKIARLKNEKAAAIFFDEMNAVVSSAQLPAMLGALQDRRIGDECFGPQCRVMAAMNPQNIAANGVRVSIPQANRLSHWAWPGVDVQRRTRYLRSLANAPHGHPWECVNDHEAAAALCASIEQSMDEHFASAWRSVVSYIHEGFLAAHPSERQKMPTPSSKEAVGPWPSDRSWTNAMALVAAAEVLFSGKYPVIPALKPLQVRGSEFANLRDNLVASCVGQATSALLSVFLNSMDLPNIEDWLRGHAKDPSPKVGDNAVFIGNLLSWMRNNANTVRVGATDMGDRVMVYAMKLTQQRMLDLGITLAQDLFADKQLMATYISNPPSQARMELVHELHKARADLDNIKKGLK
jgi:hypothetical protein